MTVHERHETAGTAPAGRVRSLLAAAAAPAEPGPLPGEAEALAAFRAARLTTRSERMPATTTPLRTALAGGATAGLLLTGVLSAAAAGTLPGAAQEVARGLLARVGVTVPGPDAASEGHADTRGASNEAPVRAAVAPDLRADRQASRSIPEQAAEQAPNTLPAGPPAPPADPPAEAGRGEELSDLAQSTESTGVDKGAEISGAASGGQSQAGEHGSAADAPNPPAGPGGGTGGSAGGGGAGEGGAGQPDDPGAAGQAQAGAAGGGRSGAGTGRRP